MKVNAEGLRLIAAFNEDYEAEVSRTEAEKIIRLYVLVPLTDNQFSALVSLVMCIGDDLFCKSEMLRLINQRKLLKAADHFDFYIQCEDDNGKQKPDKYLITHRELEKALFLMPELVVKRGRKKR